MIEFLLGSLQVGGDVGILVLVIVVLYLNRDLRTHMREEAAWREATDQWKLSHVTNHP